VSQRGLFAAGLGGLDQRATRPGGQNLQRERHQHLQDAPGRRDQAVGQCRRQRHPRDPVLPPQLR
jgi:hypothetical protein